MNNDALTEIIKAARASNPAKPGDYTGEDGLLYCGACHTRKETRITLFGTEQVVPSLCRCAVEREEAEQRALREAERQQQLRRRRENCFGTGSRKAGFTFDRDDGEDRRTMKIARGYVERFEEMRARGKGLLFLGGTGTGKTFAACCVANALLDRGYTVKVSTFAQIAAGLQSGWEKKEIYDRLTGYDLLVLDDLGAERDSGYMGEIVYTVVDARSAAKKPMLVTSNLDAGDYISGVKLAKDRIFSRLYEMCIPVSMTGRDRRRERMLRESATDVAWLMEAGG